MPQQCNALHLRLAYRLDWINLGDVPPQMGHLKRMPHAQDTHCHAHGWLVMLPRRPDTTQRMPMLVSDTKREGLVLSHGHDEDGPKDFDALSGGGFDGVNSFPVVGVTGDVLSEEERE